MLHFFDKTKIVTFSVGISYYTGKYNRTFFLLLIKVLCFLQFNVADSQSNIMLYGVICDIQVPQNFTS